MYYGSFIYLGHGPKAQWFGMLVTVCTILLNGIQAWSCLYEWWYVRMRVVVLVQAAPGWTVGYDELIKLQSNEVAQCTARLFSLVCE